MIPFWVYVPLDAVSARKCCLECTLHGLSMLFRGLPYVHGPDWDVTRSSGFSADPKWLKPRCLVYDIVCLGYMIHG